MKRAILIVAAFGGLVVWATWPAEGQLDIATCLPNGVFAKLSAASRGDAFWRTQLAGLVRSRRAAENWDYAQAGIDAFVEKSEARLNSIYEAHPQLAPSAAQIAAKRLRDLANKIEAEEAHRLIAEKMQVLANSIRKCQETIAARLL